MERIVLVLIIFSHLLFANEPDFIFWAKLKTNNLIIKEEEFHLSRAMKIDKKAKYEYLCEISSRILIKDVYAFLKQNKELLIDCIDKAYIREYISVLNLQARQNAYLSIIPVYFKAIHSNNSLLIYKRI